MGSEVGELVQLSLFEVRLYPSLWSLLVCPLLSRPPQDHEWPALVSSVHFVSVEWRS